MPTQLLIIFLLLVAPAFAQKTVPLTPDTWDFGESDANFTDHLGEAALHLTAGDDEQEGSSLVTINDLDFTNGTIEYDIAFTERTRFATVYFRFQDSDHTEHVYLRNNGPDNAMVNTSVQYAAVIDGVNLWDLSPEYQSNADLKLQEYNRVKLVVRDRQLLVYVNDMARPTLYIPIMDGDIQSGQVAFEGEVYLANITVDAAGVGELPPGSGFDPVHNDSRYLRDWRVGRPLNFPFGQEPAPDQLPDERGDWAPIGAERLGLINLSRRFGATPRGDRRLVWLKTTITAAKEQLRRLELGFSDEVYLYLNGQPLYVDKNLFGTPGMKTPRGRLSLENTTIDLPLQAGDNELLIGVTNYFFGWGLVARLDDVGGLSY